MPTEEEINGQLELLASHRRTLAIYLGQLALSGRAHARPEVFHGIDESRDRIRSIKTTLQHWNVQVNDHPDDDEIPIPVANQVVNLALPAYDRKPVFSLLEEDLIQIGNLTSTTFHRLLLPELMDCSIEFSLRIIDDGEDPSNWAGVRIRGFSTEVDHVGFGYLTYLRSSGEVEIYRKRQVIARSRERIVADTPYGWTRLRTDVVGSTLQVWVNDELQISAKDDSFGGKGFFCLHTFLALAQFTKINVYEIKFT